MQILTLITALPGAVAQGLIWGIMAIGVYITFRILDIADLTVDGTMCTGGAVCIMMMLSGHNVWISMLAATLAGMLAGLATGIFHTFMGIPAILAGILTQLSLYSVNLKIMGKANQAINVDKYNLLVSLRHIKNASLSQNTIFIVAVMCVLLIAILYWFFGTELGCSLRATGCNPNMSRAQGIIEKVMNDGSIGSTFNEGYMKVEGETAYCIDINTNFKNGYKTRADASSRMSADQISDVALSLEYVKQYGEAHKELNYKQVYLLEQCVVWQRLSVHFGWQCDNVRASYDEIPKATQDEVFSGAKAFIKENKGRYECGGYIYSGEGQELGQFWAKLNVGNAKLQKISSNTSITDGNGNYSIAGATYGVFSDKDCTKQLATLTTDKNGNTDVAEVKAGTVYIKELSAPAGYKVDKTV
jgi:uncharacterized surface anchored protein